VLCGVGCTLLLLRTRWLAGVPSITQSENVIGTVFQEGRTIKLIDVFGLSSMSEQVPVDCVGWDTQGCWDAPVGCLVCSCMQREELIGLCCSTLKLTNGLVLALCLVSQLVVTFRTRWDSQGCCCALGGWLVWRSPYSLECWLGLVAGRAQSILWMVLLAVCLGCQSTGSFRTHAWHAAAWDAGHGCCCALRAGWCARHVQGAPYSLHLLSSTCLLLIIPSCRTPGQLL
jgi:hypothetical protein